MCEYSGTTTCELEAAAGWLHKQGVQSVAIESTGTYWIPLYDLLEERGIEAVLVDARKLKRVPGRKTDMLDCQWIQKLHACGLLEACFRPSPVIRELRALVPVHPNPNKEKNIKRQGYQELRTALWRFTGVDLTRIDGIGPEAALTAISEVGFDIQRFPSTKHFASWLKVCTPLDRSAGKSRKRRGRGLGSTRIACTLRNVGFVSEEFLNSFGCLLSENGSAQRALSEEISRSEFSTGDRDLGRPELTPLGKCSGAVKLEIVP